MATAQSASTDHSQLVDIGPGRHRIQLQNQPDLAQSYDKCLEGNGEPSESQRGGPQWMPGRSLNAQVLACQQPSHDFHYD
jgi:hypothetical protein